MIPPDLEAFLRRIEEAVPTALDPDDLPQLTPADRRLLAALLDAVVSTPQPDPSLLLKLGNLVFAGERPDAAVRLYQEAGAAAERAGDDSLAIQAALNLGIALVSCHQYAAAARILDALVRRLEATDDVDRLLDARFALAQACKGMGRTEQARVVLEAALATAREHGRSLMEGRCLGQLAWFEYAEGRYESAVEQLETALGFFREAGSLTDQARACYNIGLVQADAGDYSAALSRLEEARAAAAEAGIVWGDDRIGHAIEEVRRRRDAAPS